MGVGEMRRELGLGGEDGGEGWGGGGGERMGVGDGVRVRVGVREREMGMGVGMGMGVIHFYFSALCFRVFERATISPTFKPTTTVRQSMTTREATL